MAFVTGLSRTRGGGSRACPNLNPHTTVLEGLFADLVALLAGLQLGLFDGVGLQKAVEVSRIAPGALEVIVAQRAGQRIDHGRVAPARQPKEQAAGRAAVKLGAALLGGGQL